MLLIAAVGSGALSFPCAAQTAKPSTGSTANCASLGEGFVRAPGSDTCVRMRGAVRAEAFGGSTVSSAPGGGGATDLSNATGGSGASSATVDPWKQTR